MANIGALPICSLLMSALALPNALAAEHMLMPSPQTVHIGHFAANLKPVLGIDSRDVVTIETTFIVAAGGRRCVRGGAAERRRNTSVTSFAK